MNYNNSIQIKGTTVEAIRPQVEELLKTAGFGVLTEINLQTVMKNKLDKDYLPHIILGACSPVYADKVLSIDPKISTMLPCNVTLREVEAGLVEIATINPLEAIGSLGNPELEIHAKEINDKLNWVLNNIKK